MPTNGAKEAKWYDVRLRYRGLVFIVSARGPNPDYVVSEIKTSPNGEEVEILMCKEANADLHQ